MADDKLQLIIENLHENLEIEAKNWLGGLRSQDERAKLAKEIIALANYGGGYIFIGFEENGGEFLDRDAEPGDLGAFTQDGITAVVDRFVEPPIQIRVHTRTKAGATQPHPVIEVPGGHRTPIWAKRDSPDGKTLKQATVYVRRPGAKSEPVRTQDDWEKLIDRFVGARQSDILDAIRAVLNPPKPQVVDVQSLRDWDVECVRAWREFVDRFNPDDPRRFQTGFWTFSFRINPFPPVPLSDLNTALDRQMPKHSGWPPFTYLHRAGIRPSPHEDTIQAYIGATAPGEKPVDRAEHADFWRVRRDGYGFLLRPYQEDRDGYIGNRYPIPTGPFFDWELPTFRVVELLKFIEALARAFGAEESDADILLTYYGTAGRRLEAHNSNLIVHTGATSYVNRVVSSLSVSIRDVEMQTPEIVYNLLKPVYEQFEFTELPKRLVDRISREVVTRSF